MRSRYPPEAAANAGVRGHSAHLAGASPESTLSSSRFLTDEEGTVREMALSTGSQHLQDVPRGRFTPRGYEMSLHEVKRMSYGEAQSLISLLLNSFVLLGPLG